jgi:hypothetical protein
MDGRVYGYGLDGCECLQIQQSGLEVTWVQTVYSAVDSSWLED